MVNMLKLQSKLKADLIYLLELRLLEGSLCPLVCSVKDGTLIKPNCCLTSLSFFLKVINNCAMTKQQPQSWKKKNVKNCRLQKQNNRPPVKMTTSQQELTYPFQLKVFSLQTTNFYCSYTSPVLTVLMLKCRFDWGWAWMMSWGPQSHSSLAHYFWL